MTWEIREFKTYEEQQTFIKNNKDKYQIQEVLINNSYGLDIKPLKVIRWD
jgi:hypothetical protein